ncbi:Ubiquitin-like modifier-activating enzyme 1 [Aduncisulcus paluster]|uniref:Ubiquitin-like modifier-activating enzyme 1 n=1 Tax=Aduncisulcus paluster TaxID=2918883 RepID=A0ABQ5KE54_9EUKA|nr:Ubiquitin-like modifier-activating enzyme 1 [Aduncisulcus paluster]
MGEKIDEALYSRQLYVLGEEAMKKMAASNILLIGLDGLGVEIAKNIILSGVKSVTLFDNNPVTWFDLSSNFYVGPKDVGKPRAAQVVDKLAELNSHVKVHLAKETSITESLLLNHSLVVDTRVDISTSALAKKCHELKRKYILTSTAGPCARIFVDFGENFVVTDTNGEPPISLNAITISLDVDKDGRQGVYVLFEKRHEFETGHVVKICDVHGEGEYIDVLNKKDKERKIRVVSPIAIEILLDKEDLDSLSPDATLEYVRGGFIDQVKQPQSVDFLEYSAAITSPEACASYVASDFGKMMRGPLISGLFATLEEFADKHEGRYPAPYHSGHVDEFLEIFKTTCHTKVSGLPDPLSEEDIKLIRLFSMTCGGNLCPVCATIGGIVAQEVLKGVSGKFMPIKQFLCYDCFECLPPTEYIEKMSKTDEFEPKEDRYDGQRVVFGETIQQEMLQSKYFLVGAGALGCEYLKNFALMGCGCGKEGMAHVTDMDTIETSNLSRQFLFRNRDVGKPKSIVAADAAMAMNPDLKAKPITVKVGEDTEHILTSKFYSGLDFLANALDNVHARRYIDSKCVFFGKPLLEGGTLGTKGNVQIIVPHITESYSDSQDPPEEGIPACTLHNFPNSINHTIAWAKDKFAGIFTQEFESAVKYLEDKEKFIAEARKEPQGAETIGKALNVLRYICHLTEGKCDQFINACIFARELFDDLYNVKIQGLLQAFPLDAINKETGERFWSGSKRPPRVCVFNPDDSLHCDFVVNAANLFLVGIGLKECADPEKIISVCAAHSSEQHKLDVDKLAESAVGIMEKEKEEEITSPSVGGTLDDSIRDISLLEIPDGFSASLLVPAEFEKDDDTNHHIDFITACSNLRAWNYEIPVADRSKTKMIAGKIIPAMITTTALVTGLATVELYKIVMRKVCDVKDYIELYRNAFINLALPLVAITEPMPAPSWPMCAKDKETKETRRFSRWDHIDIDISNKPETTLQSVKNSIESVTELSISMISVGNSLLWAFWDSPAKTKERMESGFIEIVEKVGKKKLPEAKMYVGVIVSAEDADGDDVDEVPEVRVKIL